MLTDGRCGVNLVIYITKKKHIGDLKISGGIGGDVVNGGAEFGGL